MVAGVRWPSNCLFITLFSYVQFRMLKMLKEFGDFEWNFPDLVRERGQSKIVPTLWDKHGRPKA